MIYTVKGFSVVNETEVDVFLEFSWLFYDPKDVRNLDSSFSAFSKCTLTYGNSQFTYCWSLARRTLTIILLACEMNAIVNWFEHSLTLPFFQTGMKTDMFLSCGQCWVFQIPWHTECSTFTASSIPAQLEFHHLHQLFLQWCFLRPTWLHTPKYLTPSEWSHHRGYLGFMIFSA